MKVITNKKNQCRIRVQVWATEFVVLIDIFESKQELSMLKIAYSTKVLIAEDENRIVSNELQVTPSFKEVQAVIWPGDWD